MRTVNLLSNTSFFQINFIYFLQMLMSHQPLTSLINAWFIIVQISNIIHILFQKFVPSRKKTTLINRFIYYDVNEKYYSNTYQYVFIMQGWMDGSTQNKNCHASQACYFNFFRHFQLINHFAAHGQKKASKC